MNTKTLILAVLLVSVFLIGCSQSPSGNYASYNQPQGQAQPNSAVGGGCGVAPSADYSAPKSVSDSAL
ncbi:MAG TPA: hypothetical protein VJJ52_08095 [Candidatus Nanoarchaeia archaeon]|nr:hypothetical protein [Candidatus Nanoarchaeia archaeon]